MDCLELKKGFVCVCERVGQIWGPRKFTHVVSTLQLAVIKGSSNS